MGIALTTARGGHGSLVVDHNSYVVGGNGNSGALDSLESATFNANGDLTTFSPVGGITLSTKRLGFGSAAVGKWFYIVGGATDKADAGPGFDYLLSLERAPIDQGGLTGSFGPLASLSLAIPRYKLTAFAFGPNLYVIGGTNGASGALASIEQGAINSNGDVTGPFSVSTTMALSTPRAGAVFLVAPPWLYAIGGHSDAGDLNTVERASVQ
jgi:hypothetical protein